MNDQERAISIQEVQKNIDECAAHTHQTIVFEVDNRCPFCGYTGKEWRIDRFGWPECPNCGAT